MAEERRLSANDKGANNNPVVVERTLDASVGKIWQALTENIQMKKWYFDLKEFRPEVGFEFRFYGGTGQKQYLHICTIVEVVPGRKLKHSWRYDGYEGNSFVTFELFEEGAKTRVKLTHEGLESFPKSNPDLARKNFLEGWTAIVGTALKEFVETPIGE